MIKNIIIFVSLLLMSNAATMAQGTTTCTPTSVYVQQHDGTGKIAYDLIKYPALQQQAITLAKAFPDPYCSAFKVYDYGFTPILQYTKGGYAEAFETMKLQCMGADRKQPYLLFVREVNQSGQVTKVWVDVNLPTDGKFSCLTATQRSLVRIRVEKAVNDVITKTPTLEIMAQVVGMEKLREQVKKIVDCCAGNKGLRNEDCTFCLSKNDFQDIIEKLELDYKYLVDNVTVEEENIENAGMIKYCKIKVSKNGQIIDFTTEFVNKVRENLDASVKTLFIFTSYKDLCNDKDINQKMNFVDIEDKYINSDADILVWVNVEEDNTISIKQELNYENFAEEIVEEDHFFFYAGEDMILIEEFIKVFEAWKEQAIPKATYIDVSVWGLDYSYTSSDKIIAIFLHDWLADLDKQIIKEVKGYKKPFAYSKEFKKFINLGGFPLDVKHFMKLIDVANTKGESLAKRVSIYEEYWQGIDPKARAEGITSSFSPEDLITNYLGTVFSRHDQEDFTKYKSDILKDFFTEAESLFSTNALTGGVYLKDADVTYLRHIITKYQEETDFRKFKKGSDIYTPSHMVTIRANRKKDLDDDWGLEADVKAYGFFTSKEPKPKNNENKDLDKNKTKKKGKKKSKLK